MDILPLKGPVGNELHQKDELKDTAGQSAELGDQVEDVTHVIQFVSILLQTNLSKTAYRYSLNLELKGSFYNDIRWYDSLANVIQVYENGELLLDLDFFIRKIAVLDRRTNLSMDDHLMELRTVAQSTSNLFTFDQALYTFSKIEIPNSELKFFHKLMKHFRAQLSFYLAILTMKRAREELWIWLKAELLTLPLLLQATKTTMDLDDDCCGKLCNLQWDIKLWKKDAMFRVSQANHLLRALMHGSDNQFLDKVSHICEIKWRSEVYQYVFKIPAREYQQEFETSYFMTHPSFDNIALRFVTKTQLNHFDKMSQTVYPESLHHLVFLGLVNLKDEHQLGNDFRCTVFPNLPFSVEDLTNTEPETLNQLDVDAFLYATILCAKDNESIRRNISDDESVRRPYRLPACISDTLCSPAQAKWWSAVYQTYTKPTNGMVSEIRLILRKGIEIVRVFGRHRLSAKLVVLLAKFFEKRAADSENSDQHAGLEARANLYWTVATSILERDENQFLFPHEFLNYKEKLNRNEVKNYLKDGQLFLNNWRMKKVTKKFQVLKNSDAPSDQAFVFPQKVDDDSQKIFLYIEFSDLVKTTYGFFIKNDVVVKHIEKLINEDPMHLLPERYHPLVAKMLAGAKKQEKDLKGGTNFVLIFCGSLLRAAQDLRKLGLSYEDIKQYFKIASKKSSEILEKLCGDSEKNTAQCKEASESENSQNISRPLISCENDLENRIDICGKELFIKGKEEDIFKTRTILNEEDFCVFPGEVPECPSACDCDGILGCFLKFCTKPSNRIMSIQAPANIALYKFFNLSWVPKWEEMNCILHNIMTKVTLLRWQVTRTKDKGGKVIVTAGRTDNFTLTFMNEYELMLITLENESELYRLQENIGGAILTDSEGDPIEEEMGRVESLYIEHLEGGTSIAVFKIYQQKNFDIKTLVFEDVTTSTTGITYDNTYRGDVFAFGVAEKLVEELYSFVDELPASIPKVVIKAFIDVLKTLVKDVVHQKRGNSTICGVAKSMVYGIGNATDVALKILNPS